MGRFYIEFANGSELERELFSPKDGFTGASGPLRRAVTRSLHTSKSSEKKKPANFAILSIQFLSRKVWWRTCKSKSGKHLRLLRVIISTEHLINEELRKVQFWFGFGGQQTLKHFELAQQEAGSWTTKNFIYHPAKHDSNCVGYLIFKNARWIKKNSWSRVCRTGSDSGDNTVRKRDGTMVPEFKYK